MFDEGNPSLPTMDGAGLAFLVRLGWGTWEPSIP